MRKKGRQMPRHMAQGWGFLSMSGRQILECTRTQLAAENDITREVTVTARCSHSLGTRHEFLLLSPTVGQLTVQWGWRILVSSATFRRHHVCQVCLGVGREQEWPRLRTGPGRQGLRRMRKETSCCMARVWPFLWGRRNLGCWQDQGFSTRSSLEC